VSGGVALSTGPQSADPLDDLDLSPFSVILSVHSLAVPHLEVRNSIFGKVPSHVVAFLEAAMVSGCTRDRASSFSESMLVVFS
jgi:hypothetical protein